MYKEISLSTDFNKDIFLAIFYSKIGEGNGNPLLRTLGHQVVVLSLFLIFKKN